MPRGCVTSGSGAESFDPDAPVLPAVLPAADARFRRTVAALGMDPDDRFVGGYVEWEWRRARHLFQQFLPAQGRSVLEFGCNVGASSIVLASLGARVTGIDVDADVVEVARANAERYGVAGATRFVHVRDTQRLPFSEASFDAVSCTSVLEYVAKDDLRGVQREIDRVLKPGGVVLVSATCNRIYPWEFHRSRRPINWLPHWIDRHVWGRELLRGVWPWQVRFGFGHYEDLTPADGGARLVDVKRRMGATPRMLEAMSALNRVLSPVGMHFGYLAPHITMVLHKPGDATP
jgi:2-polyprenyl-3-methyl-5-hydroxy-6-metoxy-1,4-benzoquinol methylase